VQFTADLMPSDLLGVSVYERGSESFVFHPGPVFAQVLLADEINRASPKTQSALLEAMEEKQVTVEGATRPCRSRFSSSPRRTRTTSWAPTRCPSRSSTAS
jgi:MoxR-like ATPase